MQKSKFKTTNQKLKIPASQVGPPCREAGQTLITLLFFMVIGITVISAASLIVAANFLSSSNSEKGLTAYYRAESGVENGILYILSHPTYSNPPDPPLTMPNADVTITYDPVSQISTIKAIGTDGNTTRTVQAKAAYSGGAFSVSEWKEQ